MTPEMIVFAIVGFITLASAVMVISTRNIFHAVLWLILTFFGVAVLYVLLNVGFFAVVQVIIYIGAIAILFIFAIMFTKQDMIRFERVFNEDWLMALILSAVFFGGMIWMLFHWQAVGTVPAISAIQLEKSEPIRLLGIALVDAEGYLIPFEVASVMLVTALIGAVYVAWGRTWINKKEEK